MDEILRIFCSKKCYIALLMDKIFIARYLKYMLAKSAGTEDKNLQVVEHDYQTHRLNKIYWSNNSNCYSAIKHSSNTALWKLKHRYSQPLLITQTPLIDCNH